MNSKELPKNRKRSMQPTTRDLWAVCYYLCDGLGSTRQLTADNQTVAASYTYDSFGNLIASSGSIANAYGFTGEQQFNEVDNLVFLRARYYKPGFGRFVSRDPVMYKAGLNLYAYVENNPINSTDPEGLYKIDASCNKSPFGVSNIDSALKDLENKILNTNCVQSPLKGKLKNMLKKLKVKCDSKTWACGYSKGGNTIYIGTYAMDPLLCGPLGSTMLHEMVHNTQLFGGSEKKSRACEASCYGYNPYGGACPGDCK